MDFSSSGVSGTKKSLVGEKRVIKGVLVLKKKHLKHFDHILEK